MGPDDGGNVRTLPRYVAEYVDAKLDHADIVVMRHRVRHCLGCRGLSVVSVFPCSPRDKERTMIVGIPLILALVVVVILVARN
jgi:hypothetical protein